MNLWHSLGGMAEAKLVSADPAGALEEISQQGIILQNVRQEQDLTLTFLLDRTDWKKLAKICHRRGYSLTLIRRSGFYWLGKRLVKRPVLLAGVAMLAALSLWLPTRIFLVEVEGNHTVPTQRILEAAENSGIRFGASRRAVRSEKMKNRLLSQVEQLKWAGVNTAGCRAVISVQEKKEEQEKPAQGIRGIVAQRDGFITQCTVTAGSGQCKPGDTVKAGQLLISPYTDCGICIRMESAKGEIMAQTRRQTMAVTPSEGEFRQAAGEAVSHLRLILGKKRINFRKCSGIWDATCDRIYKEYYITLPGGFQLPFGVAVETAIPWDTASGNVEREEAEASLLTFSKGYTHQEMIAGSILRTEYRMSQSAGLFTMTAQFQCSEMIGREILMEIGDTNEQTGGTDRECGAGGGSHRRIWILR